MHIETLKRFISDEWSTPVRRFPWFGLSLLLVMSAPIWPFFSLLQNLPPHHILIERTGVISTLTPVFPKAGGGTRVRLVTGTTELSFRVQFCRPFPASLTPGQSIVVWLDPSGTEAWQVHQGDRPICSYEDAAYQLAAANQRLPLIAVGQALAGVGLLAITFLLWQSRSNSSVAGLTGASTRTRRKRRAG